MQALRFFAALAAAQKWVQHFTDDGAGADDGYLHHDVVEALGAQARQAGHLGAAFHLEQADGVGFLQCAVNLRVILRKMREVHFFVIGIANEADGIFKHGHHAEAEQIHFDDADVGAIFFVPLNDNSAGHGGGFERNDGIELAFADDHAAGVLAEMAREVANGDIQIQEF